MNAIHQSCQGTNNSEPAFRTRISPLWKLIVPIGCLLLFLMETTRSLTLQVLADAYWQVGAFVAGTLWLFYVIQDRLDGLGRLSSLLKRSRTTQVFFAAFMGVLPGCGGAIIVMTQFVKGQVRFGALVAVLTATMGDAAILLLGTKPSAAAIVLPIALVTGAITGLCVDLIHPEGFMRPDTKPPTPLSEDSPPSLAKTSISGTLWKFLLLPTSIIALLVAFQYDAEAIFGLPTGSLTILGAVIALAVILSWALQSAPRHADGSACTHSQHTPLLQRVADDTNFVLCCVVAGFLAFELLQVVAPISITELPSQASHFLILAAIMVGWIPGCGPQILTTTLFINGAIPMSAQLGNALSNDGDALFPALALAPRAALVATFYSTIPAFIVAYGYAFLFE